jgi:hypothetical protein
MFLYTVTTLQDAVHWLFILRLTVAERKGEQWIMTESHQEVCLFEITQHRTWLYILMLGYKKYGPEQCQPIECIM